jgi:phosphoenolpyruvate synthase/pyruvate phosphate dikinase
MAENRTEEKVKRHPVDYRFDGLNWNFIKILAEIAHHAESKYGTPEQYADGRLEEEKSPMNHIGEHYRMYCAREVHDHFGDLDHQLAAIAYNAMMEYYYLHNGGPTVSDKLYKPMYKPQAIETLPSNRVQSIKPGDVVEVSQEKEPNLLERLLGIGTNIQGIK